MAVVNKKQLAAKPNVLPKVAIPTEAGRSSIVDTGSSNLFQLIAEEADLAKPEFQIELLKSCTHLAKFNGDISYAVDNVVQLGNTPCTITFDAAVSREQTKVMLKYLLEAEKLIYPGGINSLKNDLLAQVAINGCISAESIPSKDLRYIQKAVIVNPYYIRFKYNRATYEYDPYQLTPDNLNFVALGNELKKLNTIQYKYYALRRFNDSPYGIPPFISAFESIELEKDMLKNMRHVIRKLGVFGFLNVLVTAPMRKQGEKDAAYETRLRSYLADIKTQAEKGYASGINIGYKNAHEFKLEATNGNVDGIRELLNAITEMKHAGMKQDPLMLGRNFNVAETMARVIMAKLTMQIGNYQRLLAEFISDLYMLMLRMGGFSVKTCTVEFEPPMIGDKLRDEQAYEKKIANRKTLRDSGIIDQQDMAQELGYEEPFSEKDVDYSVPSAAEIAIKKAGSTGVNPDKKDPTQAADATAAGATNYAVQRNILYAKIHRDIPEFVYKVANCQCNISLSYDDKKDENLNKIDEFIAGYKAALMKRYEQTVNKVTLSIGEELAKFDSGATLQEVTDRIFYVLYNEWTTGFSVEQTTVVQKWVKSIYNYFREDTAYFSNPGNIPDAVFGLYDARALKYFENSDSIYLGKFITDKDVVKNLTQTIKDRFIKENLPVRGNPEAIQALKADIKELLDFESWKLERIVNTTVLRMRNSAAIAYMQQAEIKTYEIVGVKDSRTCRYCLHLQGMQFKVTTGYELSKSFLSELPENVKDTNPFPVSTFSGDDGFERFKSLSPDELQLEAVLGFCTHPNCRCVIKAV